MGWFEAVVLGIVQGLTEFLPISSSAHLRIVGEAFGWDDPGAAFTAITQIGTEAAVLLYFRREIGRIIVAWLGSLAGRRKGDPDARMGWLIIVGSIPIVVLGLLFQDDIETTLRDLRIVATALILFSLILFWADRVGAKKRELDQLTIGHGIAFGFAQAMALIPGVSRSGGTITMGLFLGYTRAAAARYSFLLAVPAVLGSGFFQAYEALTGDVEGEGVSWGPTILATVIAFGVGLTVIAWLLRYLDRGSFTPFVVYRIVVGGLILGLVAAGVLDADLSPYSQVGRLRSRCVPTVILLRHGRTTANTGGVLAGWTPGVLLDERGVEQVGAVAQRLAQVPLAAIVSSPLERCRQTAEAVAAGRELTVQDDDRLGEARYGDWTGRTLKELVKEPMWKVVQQHPSAAVFPGPEGEGLAQTQARAVAAVRSWNAALPPDAVWLACSHGDVIKSILADALGLHLDQFQRIVVDPASISVVTYTETRPFVLRINDSGGDVSPLIPPPRKRRRRTSSSDAAVGGGAGATV